METNNQFYNCLEVALKNSGLQYTLQISLNRQPPSHEVDGRLSQGSVKIKILHFIFQLFSFDDIGKTSK